MRSMASIPRINGSFDFFLGAAPDIEIGPLGAWGSGALSVRGGTGALVVGGKAVAGVGGGGAEGCVAAGRGAEGRGAAWDC